MFWFWEMLILSEDLRIFLSNHDNTPTNYNIYVPLHWVPFLPMRQWISLFYLRGSFWIFPVSQHSIDLLSGRIHLTWYIIHRSERQQLIASSYLILVQFIMQLHFLLFHNSSIDKLQQLIQSWAINSHCLSWVLTLKLCSLYSTCITCVRINFFRALGQRELEAH